MYGSFCQVIVTIRFKWYRCQQPVMTELFAVGMLLVFLSLPGGDQGCCCRTWVLLGQEVSLPGS